MKKYIKIMRLDHWIKQLFIVPGCVFAMFLTNLGLSADTLKRFILGFLATCFIASANYVINEYLDAEFDKYHPVKKHRPAVDAGVSGKVVTVLWIILTSLGCLAAVPVGNTFVFTVVWLWVMGILYNVKPIRTKDLPIIDVLSESVNNAIRLLMGWFIISSNTLPPCSIILGYWMGGAFLMGTKRYAEYRMINNPDLASSYRKSFAFYTESSLLLSSFFYAMLSVFFTGIFLIKYRIELILFIPAMIGLFIYYFHLSFKTDSAVQKPEKLFREKGLMLICALCAVLFIILMIVDIPWLSAFTDNALIIIG